MINFATLVAWFVVLNLVLLVLAIWCFRNRFNQQLRISFLLLLFLSAGFINCILLLQWPRLELAAADLILRFVFVFALLIFITFAYFCLTFSENNQQRRSILFWAFSINKLVLVLLMPTAYIIAGVSRKEYGILPVYGPLHAYVVFSIIGFGFYIFISMFQSYRRSDQLFLRFQLKSIMVTGLISFLLISITNGIIPLFYKSSKFSPTSSLATVFFLAGSLFIVIRGKRQYLLSSFAKVIGNANLNFFALRQYVEALRFILEDGAKSFNRRISFQDENERPISLEISNEAKNNQISETLNDEQIQGLIDTCLNLNRDNKRMFIALSRFQEEYNELLSTSTKLISVSDSYHQKVKAINDHTQSNKDFYGIEFIAYSKKRQAFLKELEKFRELKAASLILGEVGAGKRTMAKALCHKQGFHEVEEISCAQSVIDLSLQLDQAKKRLQTTATVALVISDIDLLDNRAILLVAPFLEIAKNRGGIVLTSQIALASRIERSLPSLFAELFSYTITVPSLRDCSEDIEPLINWYSKRCSERKGVELSEVSNDFFDLAENNEWPQNISGLIRSVETSLLSLTSPVLEPPTEMSQASLEEDSSLSPLELAEKAVIFSYLQSNGYNKNKTKNDLQITINTLNAKIKKYKIPLKRS